MKFLNEDFLSKCDQMLSFLQNCSLLKPTKKIFGGNFPAAIVKGREEKLNQYFNEIRGCN